MHLLNALPYSNTALFEFKDNYSIFSGVRNFRIFTAFDTKGWLFGEVNQEQCQLAQSTVINNNISTIKILNSDT